MVEISSVGIAIVLFASTNIDDIFVLLSFFSNKKFRTGHIVLGQYVGISVLVGISITASLVSLVFRPEYVGLLGLIPIAIGLKKLYDLWADPEDDHEGPASVGAGNVMAVAGVTIANGGDNIGIYTPVFATSSAANIGIFCAVFAVMVAVWLLFAHWLINHPALGAPIRRYGERATPFVLILLGLYILHEGRTYSLVL